MVSARVLDVPSSFFCTFHHNEMKLVVHIAALLANLERRIVCTHLNSKPCILFSGTRTWQDLVFDDLNVRPRRWPTRMHRGKVHAGFASRTRRLETEASAFIEEHDSFVLGGHSLGGGCAILMASLLTEQGKCVDAVYTFGVPQTGLKSFQTFYREQGLWNKTINFYTPRDPVVTRIPHVYRRVGTYVLLPYDSDGDWEHHDMCTYALLLSEAFTPPDPS